MVMEAITSKTKVKTAWAGLGKDDLLPDKFTYWKVTSDSKQSPGLSYYLIIGSFKEA